MSLIVDDERSKALYQYQLALGRVAFSWNGLHEMLGFIFVAMNGASFQDGFKTWYSVDNDGLQRKKIRAAVNAKGDDFWKRAPDIAKADIIWLLDETDSLAKDRNRAIHAPCKVFIEDGKCTSVQAFRDFGNQRAEELSGTDVLAEFSYYEIVAIKLCLYISEIIPFIWFDNWSTSWPERPRLPTERGY